MMEEKEEEDRLPWKVLSSKDKDVLYAYLAGIFDGEGCISIVYNYWNINTCAFQFNINLNNVYPKVPGLFLSVFGGRLFEHKKNNAKNQRTSITWNISKTETAKKFLDVIIPFLFIKREEAELALEYLSLVYIKGAKFIEDNTDKRKLICDKMKALKHKNYDDEYARKEEVGES